VNLIEPSQQMIQVMMTWIKDERQLSAWAGPTFRYPFTRESFTQDLRLGDLASYCLLGSTIAAANGPDQLLAFGQFYQRLNKCHLARLLVAPKQRGKGLAKVIIKLLSESGRQRLELAGDSLFVLPENLAAVRTYTWIGFEVVDYPRQHPMDDHLYMIRICF
jgi:ribosomal protein S18 acetylase RimI-like enzyme